MQRDGCRDHNENDEETSESVIRTNFRLKREVGMLASELALKLSCSPDLYMIAREELVGLSLPTIRFYVITTRILRMFWN